MEPSKEMQTLRDDLLSHWQEGKPYPGSREFYAIMIRNYRVIIRDFRRSIANPKTSKNLVRAMRLHIPVYLDLIQELRGKLGMNDGRIR